MTPIPENLMGLSAVKLALAARQMRARIDGLELLDVEPIAITGMSCRFPGGASNPESFWRLLENGVDAITEVPATRWDAAALYDADPAAPGKMSTRYGGFLDQVDLFDCDFFGISPREAACMDPQQRLLLEVAWEALENGGHAVESLAGSRTGVYIGVSGTDYLHQQLAERESIGAYASTGNAYSILANRVSYLLDLRGPSIAIDTACSSSLVGVHLACQSLRRQECDLAIAGGVNLILSPAWTISFSKFGMMAPDGRCKTFDARANGYVRGEGIGAVALRRLSDALSNGDPILAVIRGSAINQDGQSNGLTAPNLLAQKDVIRQALSAALVQPSQIAYVETHGTGTVLGDPIEFEALSETVGRGGPETAPCALGAVKSNIGHLEAAAGIAGLIKVVLALQHGAIPRNLHFERLNPHITLEGTRLLIPTRTIPWPTGVQRRVASVSSFGLGGTNAHVVLEESPAIRAGQNDEPDPLHCCLLPLSARSRESLLSLGRAFVEYLRQEPDRAAALRDIAYTACVRRQHHRYRLCVTGSSREEMAARLLESLDRSETSDAEVRPRVTFVFSGQGADWHGAGQELLKQERTFAAKLQECDALLRSSAGWSLMEELAAAPEHSRMADSRFGQPALFSLQVALSAQWHAWGIEPDAVVGHSIGEVAAAHVAGALSLKDALQIAVERGRLMHPATGNGRMAAVDLPEQEAGQFISAWPGRLSVSAINSPSSTVLSGDPAALEEALGLLDERKIFFRRLSVDFAFHSPQMEPYREGLVHALAGIAPQDAKVPIVSTVLGQMVRGHELDAAYWGRNMRDAVRFSRAVEVLLEEGHGVFLEVAPHPVLARSLRQCADSRGAGAKVLPSLRRGQPEQAVMLSSLGTLYAQGCTPAWDALFPNSGHVVPLPAYPWQRERHWFAPQQSAATGSSPEAPQDGHPLLGRRIEIAHLPDDHVWEIDLDCERIPYLREHRIRGVAVLPASAYVEMALAAAGQIFGRGPHELVELELHRTLVFPEGQVRTIQVRLSPGPGGDAAIQVHSRAANAGEWTFHAGSRVQVRNRQARGAAS